MPQPATPISDNLPTAARKQAKEANRLIAELNAPPGAQPVEPPAPGAVPPQPAAAAAPVVVPPPEDPVKALEHKFSVLAGKYNAETSRLMGQVQALRDENQRLLETPRPSAAAVARPEDTFDLSSVTPKEREEFGEELVQLMARIAKANSGSEVKRLTQQLAALQGQVQQTSQIGAETRMEKVWNKLDATIPNWRVVNNSQQFIDWLANIDIMSGRPRQEGLTAAFDTGDGSRVAGIFARFLEEDSQSRSTSQDPAPPAAQVNRETLIAPGSPRGSGGEAPNGSSGRIWSEQEITDFYSRVQRGRISPEEKKQGEAEIMAAVTAGLVRPNRDDRHIANSR